MHHCGIREILDPISEFSDPKFTRAPGRHGGPLTDAAFSRAGFRIMQSEVRDVDGRRRTKSNHDRDRIVQRDGVRYGVEIRNRLGWIDQTEFPMKFGMCLRCRFGAMFIARMMPTSHNHREYKRVYKTVPCFT